MQNQSNISKKGRYKLNEEKHFKKSWNYQHFEVFIPVEAVSNELDAVITKCENSYRKDHPEVTNVAFNMNLVFTMGYANPEFELQIVVFDKESGDTFEEFDDFFVGDIELSEEQKKQIKKVMWDRLGKTLFNL